MPLALPALADAFAQQRPLGQPATTHAHPAAALHALLLALLASLLGRQALTAPLLRQFAAILLNSEPHAEAADSALDTTKARNRLLACVGWIMRGTPNRGMAPRAIAACEAMSAASCPRPHAPRAPPLRIRAKSTLPPLPPPAPTRFPGRIRTPSDRATRLRALATVRRSDCTPPRAPP